MSELDQARKHLAEAEARRVEREREALRRLLASDDARGFIRRLIRETDVIGPVFRSPDDQVAVVHFREGRRSVGLQLVEAIDAVLPGSYAGLLIDGADEDAEIVRLRKTVMTLKKSENAPL